MAATSISFQSFFLRANIDTRHTTKNYRQCFCLRVISMIFLFVPDITLVTDHKPLTFVVEKISQLQYTTQRVYIKRDLFKTLTSVNIARDHHNRIIHRFIQL